MASSTFMNSRPRWRAGETNSSSRTSETNRSKASSLHHTAVACACESCSNGSLDHWNKGECISARPPCRNATRRSHTSEPVVCILLIFDIRICRRTFIDYSLATRAVPQAEARRPPLAARRLPRRPALRRSSVGVVFNMYIGTAIRIPYTRSSTNQTYEL